MKDHTPPHSHESEQALLGAVLLMPSQFDEVSWVKPEDFYQEVHGEIWRAIRELQDNHQHADAVTVSDWFHDRDKSDLVGGGSYLTKLASEISFATNVKAYARTVRDKSMLRQLVDVCTNLAGQAYEFTGNDPREIVDIAEQKLFSITTHRSKKTKHAGEVLKDVHEELAYRSQNPGTLTGIPTGFANLDAKTNGLNDTDLIIVAGRPSMGKTTFAMNIAENVAIHQGIPVGVFSLEMSSKQLGQRLVVSQSGVDFTKFKNGDLKEHDWDQINKAYRLINQAPLYIDDEGALTPMQLRGKARRMQREHGIKLIVVDYLQLMQIPSMAGQKVNEITEISRNLKALAKELDVPVIALSQLNRALESRPNKRPIMADLRESGGIEQDADQIIFIYREEVYKEETAQKGIAEVILRKNRNGSIGSSELLFQGHCVRFQNLEHRYLTSVIND